MNQNQGAFGPYEGAFASPVIAQNLESLGPFASALAGPGGFVAGPGGLLQGRFGYGHMGIALNSQTDPSDILGVVIPLRSVNGANGAVIGGPASLGGSNAAWTWQVWDKAFRAWRMRQGIVCTLMPAGNFWLRFAGGANYGDIVYASLSDGSAYSGAVGGAVQTPWRVCSNASAGCLAVVSTTAKFN